MSDEGARDINKRIRSLEKGFERVERAIHSQGEPKGRKKHKDEGEIVSSWTVSLSPGDEDVMKPSKIG